MIIRATNRVKNHIDPDNKSVLAFIYIYPVNVFIKITKSICQINQLSYDYDMYNNINPIYERKAALTWT